jgi:hypothetical protein
MGFLERLGYRGIGFHDDDVNSAMEGVFQIIFAGLAEKG